MDVFKFKKKKNVFLFNFEKFYDWQILRRLKGVCVFFRLLIYRFSH